MWQKVRMVVLWCGAIGAFAIVATQSSTPSWLAASWVATCVGLALWATVMFQVAQKRQKRWNAGDYENE
ncbi:MAG TPA: hypothetical protein VJT73_17935 [Polyangiaceae bacterium]|nr:hypothetical protein [Polyangiaceae bacterium]